MELIEGLKEHFDDLKDCIKDVKISLKAEIHSLENTLLMKINDAKYDAEEARKIASKNEAAINKLQTDFNDLKNECMKLKFENRTLKEQGNNIETYSRKNNIIIRGLRETENESNDQCEHMVRLFLLSGNRQFGINEDFPREVAMNRRKLYIIYHRAKRIIEGR